MKCKVTKVWAPNGEESILYNSLKEHLTDIEALEVWATIRTPRFKTVNGDWQSEKYAGELDENGEPLIDDVFPEFKEDTKIREQAKKAAIEYAKSSENVEKLTKRFKDVLTRRIADLKGSRGEGAKTLLARQTKLRQNLSKMNWKEAIQKFAASAKGDIDYARRRLEKELAKDSPNPRTVQRFKAFLNSFDLLNDLRDELRANQAIYESMKSEDPELGTMNTVDMLNNIIADKDAAKRKYANYMKDKVAKSLADMSFSKDEQSIAEMLEFAPSDISAWDRWLEYAGDSRDTVVSLVAKIINEQQQKTRHWDIEFSRKATTQVEALEKAFPQYKGNPEKLYGPMLAKDAKGQLTGKLITPNMKEMWSEFKEKYDGTQMMEFYKFFTENYQAMNEMLPTRYQMGSRIPTILKSKLERVLTSENKLAMAKEYAGGKIMASNQDTELGMYTDDAGNIVSQIPVLFTGSYDSMVWHQIEKQLEKENPNMGAEERSQLAIKEAMRRLPKSLSYDLGNSLQMFGHMAKNYENLNEVLDVVEGAKELVYERQLAKTDSNWKQIMSKATDLEDRRIALDGSESNAYKMIESLVASQVYGQAEVEMGSFNMMGVQVDTRKLLKQIQKYNSALMLGINVMAGTANVAMGSTMQWAEAIGGEYYKSKDYMKAKLEYNKQLPTIMADATRKHPTSKIGLINEYYDVLGDYYPGGAGAKDSSFVRRAAGNGSLFFVNQMGEHMMQSKANAARMIATSVYDKSGKRTGNLYDAHEVIDGKLKLKDGTYVKNPAGELVSADSARNMYSRQVQVMLRKLHGNYNKQTAAAWQRHAHLQLIGQFRKWIADGFARRWQKTSYNEFAEQELEGTYRSTGRFMVTLFKDLQSARFDLSTRFNELTPHQKANVKRTTFEVGMIIAMAAGTFLLTQLAGGLDEDRDKGKLYTIRYASFMTNRLFSELLFFVDPRETWTIMKTPMAAQSTINQIGKTMKYSMPWNWDEMYEAGVNKGDSKFLHNLGRSVPVWKQIDRMSPDGVRSTLEYFNLN